MVVRPQRRGVLPHRGFPRHDVLLPAGAGRPSDLLLPDVHHQLLGHHLLLHVGRIAPPALHGAAAVGANARHDLLADAADPLLGLCRKRAADAERRLAQGPRRRNAALHDGCGGILRPHHLRRIVHDDPLGQLAVALHRLDHRPRACRCARLGRDDYLRVDLRLGAMAVEARGHVFGTACRSAFLARAGRHRDLRL
jgi:hypothetical protein